MTRDTAAPTQVFEAARPRLLKLAYRMLGSLSDAEDVAQDLYIRWLAAEAEVAAPDGWLVTACARLCIDRLRAAKRARAAYDGPWLPDPLVTWDDASVEAERADDLTMAMLLVLERLTPRERAAFLLREGFDYDYAEIGAILGASPAACRQLASRAARRLREERPRYSADREAARNLARQFGEAARSGDAARLVSLLAVDALCATDGGGKVRAALNVIRGADRVARFIVGVMGKGAGDVDMTFAWVNGAPGWVLVRDGAPIAVATIEIDDGRIRRVLATLNPDKIQRVPPRAAADPPHSPLLKQ
jgi:RNA polymerase sigma-70 factor (ECF subfamily)